ncbi:MAG: alginate export family protein, partial [Pseudomonadota bacterium]
AALIEFNHVVAYANSKFNEGQGLTPSRANKPIIRDPNGTALTRAYLQYNKFSDYTFRLGRQFIDLDDERFIGSDQFRQTPQNYDAFTMTSTVFYQMELYYAYIFQVNTVYSGSGAPTSTNNHQTHAVNISWNGLPYGTLTGYAYLVNDRATITNSTNTLGVRLEGDWLLGSLDTGYVLEYAHQRDAHDNPTHFSADYTAAKVYTGFAPLQLYAAYQVFDGNVVSGRGFRTPLASFSRLNGWAEQFNPLPDAGLIDINGGILGRVSNIALELHYHLFKSETPQRKIAQEYDVSISKHLFSHYQMGIDYARFIAQPGSGYSDAHKIWLTLEANY